MILVIRVYNNFKSSTIGSMTKKRNASKKKKQTEKVKKLSFQEKFERYFGAKYTGLYVAGIFLIVMCVISYTFHKIGDYGVETDFYQSYVPAAQALLHGNIMIDGFRGPGYQIVLGTFGFIFGDFFNAGIFIAILSAAVFIYFTFETLKRLFSLRVSALVVILMIFNTIFIQYSYSAGTDMFFAALLSIVFYLLFKNETINYKNLILASFISGYAYLTRYNGVFILGFLVIILFVNYWQIDWKKRTKYSLTFLVVFFATITPWGIYCLKEKGNFFYNENFRNVAYELYGKGKIGWDQFWYGSSDQFTSLSGVILKDPVLFLKHTAGNIYIHFIGDMNSLLGWYIGVFVILGIVFFIYNFRNETLRSRKNSYLIMNIFFFIILLLVFYSERFSIFLIPFYLVFAVTGLIGENKSLSKIFAKQFVNFVVLVLVVISVVTMYGFNSSRIDSGPEEILLIKNWYFDNVPEKERGKTIAARKPQISYYLDMTLHVIPLASNYEQFISKLRKEKDDYLYFSLIEAQTRPRFQFLLNPISNHPGLKTVVYIQNPPAVLYKVLDDTK